MGTWKEGQGWIRGAALGALGALALFAAEGVAIARDQLNWGGISWQGPWAKAAEAVRPALPGLLGRAALAYLLLGAALGVLAWVLAEALRPSPRRLPWLAAGQWVVLVAGLGSLLALGRPALLDDIPVARPWLSWITAHAQPRWAWTLAALYVGGHFLRFLLHSPRRWGGWVAAAALAAVAWGGPRPEPEPQAPPPPAKGRAPTKPQLVVLVGLDAFRPDRLRALGGTGEVAPHLESFLEDATLFTRAYTPLAQTDPAWRALLTGRWPHRTGVRYPLEAHSRREFASTFPARLSEVGFRTVFATDCSRFHFETEQSGFEERHQPPSGALNFALEKLRFRALGAWSPSWLGPALVPEWVENRAMAGVYDPISYAQRLASRLVESARAGKTLFAYHATAAHFPGDPVYPFYRRFVPPGAPLESWTRMHFSPLVRPASGPKAKPAPVAARRSAEALYDALLAEADAQLGVLVESLRQAGLYDDAWVIVFSDHGESFHADQPDLQGAMPVHGARLSDEENRIVLAVKRPGRADGPRTVDSLVRLIDIGPTLLDGLGMLPLDGADGESLMPLLRGEPAPPRWLLAETGFTHATPDTFDSGHWSGAPRDPSAYRIEASGVVEVGLEAHLAILQEKDVGVFDGERWLVRSLRKDGRVLARCHPECPSSEVRDWFERTAPPFEGLVSR